jgi:hypothetical protein
MCTEQRCKGRQMSEPEHEAAEPHGMRSLRDFLGFKNSLGRDHSSSHVVTSSASGSGDVTDSAVGHGRAWYVGMSGQHQLQPPSSDGWTIEHCLVLTSQINHVHYRSAFGRWTMLHRVLVIPVSNEYVDCGHISVTSIPVFLEFAYRKTCCRYQFSPFADSRPIEMGCVMGACASRFQTLDIIEGECRVQ